MIPSQVTLVPLYVVTRQLGLIDNILAVILPGSAAVFGVFLMRQYIQTLPSELEDAARIDGCSEIQVFTNVILPLCKPAVAALAIFSFVRNWNDFLWPLIVLNKSVNYTLTVGVTGAAHAARPADFGQAPASDAKVKGTPYHATGPLPCRMGDDKPVECAFGVIRGKPGNA